MKYIISLIIISLTVILSCNTKKESSSLLSKDNLPIEKFTINTGRDTVLQTENGALLKISAGSLENKSGSNVTLEIKEAYSIQQIIKAGLYTQSNGQALSSGGMIYINAAAGQEVAFKQKINVAIPTDYLQKGMELYKGEEMADGKINWSNPGSLPENKQQTSIEKGKILFENKCAGCHAIGHSYKGPDLAHFPKRIPYGEENSKYWYHFFRLIYTPYRFDFETKKADSLYSERWSDPYACNLINLFNGPIEINLQSDTFNLFDIYDYIQNESNARNLPFPSHAGLKDCIDSCKSFKERTEELKRLKNFSEKQRENFIKDNGEMVIAKPDSINRTSDTIGFNRKVSPENFDATYYQFTIDSFGWFNIDILLNQMDGVKESQLFVRIIGKFRERINVFLIIPSVKVYGEGGTAESGDDRYVFFRTNGNIPLPQHEKAFILAVTEHDEKIAFSLKEFTTGLKQEFDIELKESTKEKFEMTLKDFDADRLHIKVDKTINADSIRAKDKEIKNIDIQLKEAESLKPKNCNCDCGEEGIKK